METVTIRDLSGERIARASEGGHVLGVTNMGALVGVIVPLTGEVIQRMADRDAVRVRERAEQSEEELASGRPMSTVSELLQHAQSGRQAGLDRVSIRQISGARLERAARDGHPLLISSGRATLALLIPVTSKWLERLVEGEITRVIDGSPSDQAATSGKVSGSQSAPPSGDLATVPAVGMLTPRREVLPQQNSLGQEIVWQRAIGIRVDADPADDRSRLLGVVTDTVAKVLGEPITRELASIDESDFYNSMLLLIDDLRARIVSPEYLIGIGLEIGGHVHQGQIIRSFNVHWDNFPLGDRLNAAFRLPVVIENDANALAVLERRFHGVAEDNLAVILITYQGIGCGLVVDGHLYRASSGMAGEHGHIPAGQPASRASAGSDDDQWCRCGNLDCLERAATPRAIGYAKESRNDGGYDAALGLMTTDDRVRKNFERAGQALGRGVATVINLFNPSAIVFYGPSELLGSSREFHIGTDIRRETDDHPYLGGMVEAISINQFSTGASDCRFIVRKAVDSQSARAAAACVINRLMPTSQILQARPVTVQTHRPDISTVPGGRLATASSAWLHDMPAT